MAATPPWKVFRRGEYVASCHYAEDAAAVVGLSGGDVRFGGHAKRDIVFTEGAEEVSAADSYDGAAAVMRDRVEARLAAARRA
ncbi:hypothetical protein [Roseomonas sp. WA12]